MAILFKNVSYTYQAKTPFAVQGLTDINFSIKNGSYTAIIGQTGSGKSTLINHLNGLLKPTAGFVQIDDQKIQSSSREKELRLLRQKVGVVFQFPENQLFANTVEEDIEFGPLNFGMSKTAADQIAAASLIRVGLTREFLTRSPLELSGGQMRRVAIAGVLATQPEILVLDEPTAGLDFIGQQKIMKLVKNLQLQQHMTILLVTHSMEDVANDADQVLFLEKGHLVKQASVSEMFHDQQWLAAKKIIMPQSLDLANKLIAKGVKYDGPLPINETELTQFFQAVLAKKTMDKLS